MKPWPGLRGRGADGRGGAALLSPAGGLGVVSSVLHGRICGLVYPVAVGLAIGKLPGKAHAVSATAGKGIPRHNRNALISEVVAKSVAGAPIRVPAIHKNNYALQCEPSIKTPASSGRARTAGKFRCPAYQPSASWSNSITAGLCST